MLSNLVISAKESKDKAIAFLQQSFTVARVETPELDHNTWKIKAYVSAPKQRIFHIRIHAITGQIMGF